MQVDPQTLSTLATRLTAERKRQGLSRDQAAAISNVSASFIRDAESDPGRCSLARMIQLVEGLGLTLELSGFQPDEPSAAPPHKALSR